MNLSGSRPQSLSPSGPGIPATKCRSRRLVVVADDFGRSHTINRAIARAHDEGILTAATLMPTGKAFDEAVAIAAERPNLSVGVHLTLCDGDPMLPPETVAGLTEENESFPTSPALAGLRIWWRRKELRPRLYAEISAQIERVIAAGAQPRHIDGHHHLHMHPVIFQFACSYASQHGIRWVRIPSDDLPITPRGNPWRRWAGKLAEGLAFRMLAKANRAVARTHNMRSANRVFGLNETGRLNESYLLHLINRLPAGISEVFAHPDGNGEAGKIELAALTSQQVREQLDQNGIVLTNYADLHTEDV